MCSPVPPGDQLATVLEHLNDASDELDAYRKCNRKGPNPCSGESQVIQRAYTRPGLSVRASVDCDVTLPLARLDAKSGPLVHRLRVIGSCERMRTSTGSCVPSITDPTKSQTHCRQRTPRGSGSRAVCRTSSLHTVRNTVLLPRLGATDSGGKIAGAVKCLNVKGTYRLSWLRAWLLTRLQVRRGRLPASKSRADLSATIMTRKNEQQLRKVRTRSRKTVGHDGTACRRYDCCGRFP